jgi:hypothetical protein
MTQSPVLLRAFGLRRIRHTHINNGSFTLHALLSKSFAIRHFDNRKALPTGLLKCNIQVTVMLPEAVRNAQDAMGSILQLMLVTICLHWYILKKLVSLLLPVGFPRLMG